MNPLFLSWPVWLSPWDWSSSDWAGLTFLVITAAAVVAWRQVKEAQRLREEQQRLREEQARPFVVIDFEPWNPFLDLKITNVGKTLARNVQFEFDPPLTSAKDERPGLVPIAETNLFKNGIASFPPGKEIRLWFDSFPSRVERGLPERYDVLITYIDPSGRPYSEPAVLDLAMYRDIGQIERYGIHDVHNRLKEIERTLKRWTHPEGIKVLTREDRRRYADELRAELAEREDADEESTTPGEDAERGES